MITKHEILALVKEYVDKSESLDAFSQKFAELFYDIEKTGDSEAIQAAYAVESELAAATAGVSSELSLRKSLSSLLPSVAIVAVDPIAGTGQMIVSQFNYSVAVERGWVIPKLADTQLAWVFSSETCPQGTLQTNRDLVLAQQVLTAQ